MPNNPRPQKLELTWIDKEVRPLLEPRILLEDAGKSHHAKVKNGKKDQFENMLIFGDNLLALKSLEQKFTGKVKCVYIDPPYNTGSAFEHYDDGIEHSLWLGLMRHRLELLKKLLAENGSIWISLDDNEVHYCKIMMDELFGRANFVANVVWQKRTSPDMRATLGAGHDHILVFSKNLEKFKQVINPLPKSDSQKANYRNPDSDPRGPWVSADFTAQGWRPNQMYKIKTPGGAVHAPPEGRCWKNVESVLFQMIDEGRMWFGQDGNGVPRQKVYLSESAGQTAWTWWTNAEVGHNQEAKKEIIQLFGASDAFITPKPERLIHRILSLATNPGDLVLDSFAGSGTTGAVAHKMGRKWIMVELGEHCHTHIIPRLKKVIDGDDPGGVTKETGWEGGGGFRYFKLAPSLLQLDKYGFWIINKEYNAAMLAEALCKIEGFTYAPSETVYWQHGIATETAYIYVTTQHLDAGRLAELSEEVGKNRSLMVLCTSFSRGKRSWPNLAVKKIPRTVLAACEWGHDDYSLKVENLPKAPKKVKQRSLFDEEE